MCRYIMGVDAGGTKTYAVITDHNGRKIGSGLSGEANHQTIGMERAYLNIKEAIDLALKDGGLDYHEIDFTQYGLAGADRPIDFQIIEPALKRIPLKRWDLVCDTMIGLRTGSRDNEGVALVCGTGTNAAGRTSDGTSVQTGGFGYMFGDEAGGSHLALETFRASIRSWEQREIPSSLVKKVPKFLGFASMEELVDYYLDNQIDTVSNGLTIVLHEAAKEGDKLSIHILEKMGTELGRAAKSVIKRLGEFTTRPIPIVLIGGVLQKGRSVSLLNALRKTIVEEFHEVEFITPKMEPVYGANLLGMDRLGIPTTLEVEEKFIQYGGYQD